MGKKSTRLKDRTFSESAFRSVVHKADDACCTITIKYISDMISVLCELCANKTAPRAECKNVIYLNYMYTYIMICYLIPILMGVNSAY